MAPFLTYFQPGSFYSSVPDLVEIEAQADRVFDRHRQLTGITLSEPDQLALFRQVASLASDAPFLDRGMDGHGLRPTTRTMGLATP